MGVWFHASRERLGEGHWKANWDLKGEKSVLTPLTLVWDYWIRTLLLLCMFTISFKDGGKNKKEIHSDCPAPSFPWKISVIVHHF